MCGVRGENVASVRQRLPKALSMPTTATAAESSPRKYWLWAGYVAAGVVLGGGIFYGYLWMRQKSVGTVHVGQLDENQPELPQEVAHYTGAQLAFDYPATYQIQSQGKATPPILERAVLSRNDIEGRRMVVLVQNIPNLSIEEYGSYRLRAQDLKAYKKEKVMLGEKQFTFFTKETAVFEVGAFWQEGTRAYSIVVSSPLEHKGLREELENVLQTLTVKASHK